MLDYMQKKNVKGFWALWKSRTRNVQGTLSYLGKSTMAEAADNLASKFKTNFVNSSDNTALYSKYIQQVSQMSNDTVNFKINVELVERSLLSINDSSCLDVHGLCKSHILYAHAVLRSILAKLYSACLTHCFVPSAFTKIVFMPLLKDKTNNVDNVSNYRPIAIVPIIAKIFEACIGNYLCAFLDTHDNQLGFVKGGGCSRAICALRTTLQYFLNYKSPIYICTLDAEKAFDRVNHFGLLSELIKRGVCKMFILLLQNWFSSIQFCVCWGSVLSCVYNIHSGVLQGSLLSPKFFNVFINSLLGELEQCDLGCRVFGCFFGAIFYADDIVLLSGSMSNLQYMIDICVNFGRLHGISYNPLKSQCMALHPSQRNYVPPSVLKLGECELGWVHRMRYLGVFIVNNPKGLFDVSAQVTKFYGSVHALLAQCGNLNRELVMLEILRTKCAPILFYGLDAISINNDIRDVISKAWNWAIRSVFGIKKRESTRLLLKFCNMLSANFKIDCLQLCLIASLKDCSNNSMLRSCGLLGKYNSFYNNLRDKYEIAGFCNPFDVKKSVWIKFDVYCEDYLN
jgi:hypothetical protein